MILATVACDYAQLQFLEPETSMNNIEHLPHLHHSHHDHRPYWRRAHHDWRFWFGVIAMFVAIAVYVGTNDLSMRTGRQKRLPPAVSRVP
jgi:hypothetical protein